MRIFVIAFFTVCALYSSGSAQDTIAAPVDTVTAVKSVAVSETTGVTADTITSDMGTADQNRHQHEVALQPEGEESRQKIKLIKRNYDYKRQVFFALGMMAFIAIMMSSSQSWNPK